MKVKETTNIPYDEASIKSRNLDDMDRYMRILVLTIRNELTEIKRALNKNDAEFNAYKDAHP